MNTILTFDSDKSIVLIGLMGAGKSSIGRRLADALSLDFVDTDDEIVKAAGCSIPDIFELYGEAEFRDLEERVIDRILHEPACIIATGGGAYMRKNTRSKIDENATTVWLRADLDILVERTGRRGGRPLLEQGNPREILKGLMDERYPVYENADIVVDTGPSGHEVTVDRIITSLQEFAKASA
jgi:shikimate kinase